jgi:hypothetical protein
MGMKKIRKQIDNLITDAYWKGWSIGWDSAFKNQIEEEFDRGWAARSDNVEERLEGLFEAYTATRKFREAQHVKEIIDYLNTYIDIDEDNKGDSF